MVNKQPKKTDQSNQPKKQSNQSKEPIEKEIVQYINSELNDFQNYPIRKMVEHAEKLGPKLKNNRLETNQIRKFLDAINRVKTKLAQNADEADQEQRFQSIEPEIVLLKPKLAYAAARKTEAEPLNQVISIAISKVHSIDDFNRLVQFVESIVAYHKAEGGK